MPKRKKILDKEEEEEAIKEALDKIVEIGIQKTLDEFFIDYKVALYIVHMTNTVTDNIKREVYIMNKNEVPIPDIQDFINTISYSVFYSQLKKGVDNAFLSKKTITVSDDFLEDMEEDTLQSMCSDKQLSKIASGALNIAVNVLIKDIMSSISCSFKKKIKQDYVDMLALSNSKGKSLTKLIPLIEEKVYLDLNKKTRKRLKKIYKEKLNPSTPLPSPLPLPSPSPIIKKEEIKIEYESE